MRKPELIKKIAEKAGVTHKTAEFVLSAYADLIYDVLEENHDEEIPLMWIGRFKVKTIPARNGVSALTGQPWHKDEHPELCFKMSKSVKTFDVEEGV